MRQFDLDSSLVDSARPQRDLAPKGSEPAIIGFAAFSLLGAIAMSFYCRMGLESVSAPLKPAASSAVYAGKAVPFDDMDRPLGAAKINAAPQPLPDNLQAVVNDGRRTRTTPVDENHAPNATGTIEGAPRYSFPEFDALERAANLGSASAVAANAMTQSASGNIEAPSAALAAFAPVPESNSWSVAGAFALLLCVVERLRRRFAQRA